MFTLGRKIDINYPTNRIMIIATIIVAGLGWIVTGNPLSGLSIGIGVFLTWALAREVDPKHEYSAFLAAAFALINLLYYKSISLLVIFWILLLLRTVNGITGKELTASDIFSVLGLSIYLSFNNSNGIYLILFILAMCILIAFKERTKISLLASGVAVAVFIVEIFFLKYSSFNGMDYLNGINIVVIAIIFIFILSANFISKGEILDDVGNRARKPKIISGQILFSIIAILLLLFGDIGLNNLIIYLSVIVGVLIYFIVYKTFNFKRA